MNRKADNMYGLFYNIKSFWNQTVRSFSKDPLSSESLKEIKSECSAQRTQVMDCQTSFTLDDVSKDRVQIITKPVNTIMLFWFAIAATLPVLVIIFFFASMPIVVLVIVGYLTTVVVVSMFLKPIPEVTLATFTAEGVEIDWSKRSFDWDDILGIEIRSIWLSEPSDSTMVSALVLQTQQSEQAVLLACSNHRREVKKLYDALSDRLQSEFNRDVKLQAVETLEKPLP